MKLTFPHMGNTYIATKVLLDELGADYVIPPFNNRRALEIGTKYAPELACLPLKINLGNYIQAYGQGADTIMITGGCGPCRFGYYSEIERGILRDAGLEMDVIALEMPDGGPPELFSRIKRVTGGLNACRLAGAVRRAAQTSLLVDELERLTYRTRPRELLRGSTDRIYGNFRNDVLKAKGFEDVKRLIHDTADSLERLETDHTKIPLMVGIVGEIYTTIDSYTNMNIDMKLGNMGIEVHRAVTVSEWVFDHMLKKALHLPCDTAYIEAAKPYLGAMIGGHARETVGNAVLYAKRGFSGIVQIYPLGCMPEIVAQSILPSVERDHNIPILTLIIDEMTGEAGYMTRLEAFLDVLERRSEDVYAKL